MEKKSKVILERDKEELKRLVQSRSIKIHRRRRFKKEFDIIILHLVYLLVTHLTFEEDYNHTIVLDHRIKNAIKIQIRCDHVTVSRLGK
jgi:hypothetical protein